MAITGSIRQSAGGYLRRRSADIRRSHHFASRRMAAPLCGGNGELDAHSTKPWSNHHNTCIVPPISTPSLNHPSTTFRRNLSEIGRGGADLLAADATSLDGKRKIVLDSYMPTGFDVLGMLDHAADYDDEDDEKLQKSQTLHINGSMIAFQHSCFLWNVDGPRDVTLESLSLVMLRDPSVEFLFIGCNHTLPPREMNRIRREMKEKGIVVEQLDLTNAMGTFNILNGEDRRVAAALVLDRTDT